MNKTAMIRARVEPKLKSRAESIFRRLGLSPTEALTIFYRQVELRRGLPFEVAVPGAVTIKTFKDTDAGRDIVVCSDAKDMFGRLGI